MTTIGETAQSDNRISTAVEPIVYVVDDDRLIREMLSSLFRSVGLRVRLFESAKELLQSELEDAPSCLVLDIRLPRLNGFDLQAELAKSNIRIPIIFLTGHGDISMSVRAMKAGAVDFLTKPFREQEMLDAVTAALERDQKRRSEARSHSDLQGRFAQSTMNRGGVQLMSGTQARSVDDWAVTPRPNEKSLPGYQDHPTETVHARTRTEGSMSDAKNRVPMQPSAEVVRTCNAQAHEMVDAIAAAVTYAQVGLKWLRGEPPNLEEVHRALNDIVSAGKRAAKVAVRLHSPT